MKLIPLTQGLFAKVDDEHFELLNKFNWSASKNRHTHYAQRGVRVNGKRVTVKMHRIIMEVTNPEEIIDHINHDGLDNQKQNLRIVTHSLNQSNRRSIKRYSPHVGVYVSGKRYRAFFTYKKSKFFLGFFDNANDAKDAYLYAIKNPEPTIKRIINELFSIAI